MHTVKVSSKRQIAIPKSFLDELGVDFGGRLRIEKDRGSIKLSPIKGSITRSLAGSLDHLVPEDKKGVPFSKIMEETKRKVAKKLAKDGLD